MEPIDYATARKVVQSGDVVAFGGKSLLSKIVKAAGKTVVSHSGVIVTALAGDTEPQFFESTVRLKGSNPVSGARVTSFQNRWNEYDGELWLLPLAAEIRKEFFDEPAFRDFVAEADGKDFDLGEGFAIIWREILEQLEGSDLVAEQYYFCSELVADAFLHAGTIADVDPSEVSPKDLCRWKMYGDTYFVREGQVQTRRIRRFNTLPRGTT